MADPDGAKCLQNIEMATGYRTERTFPAAGLVLLLDGFPVDGQGGFALEECTENRSLKHLERETGIEPATSSLGSWRSTAELLPLKRRVRNGVSLPSSIAGYNRSTIHGEAAACALGRSRCSVFQAFAV